MMHTQLSGPRQFRKSKSSPRRVPGHVSAFAKFQPTHRCPTLMLPGLKVGAEPMCPEASGPGVGVERAQSENAPLLGLPCRVEPKRLTKHAEDWRPSSPAFALVLRKPDRDQPTEGDANLIWAQRSPPRASAGPKKSNVAVRDVVP